MSTVRRVDYAGVVDGLLFGVAALWARAGDARRVMSRSKIRVALKYNAEIRKHPDAQDEARARAFARGVIERVR